MLATMLPGVPWTRTSSASRDGALLGDEMNPTTVLLLSGGATTTFQILHSCVGAVTIRFGSFGEAKAYLAFTFAFLVLASAVMYFIGETYGNALYFYGSEFFFGIFGAVLHSVLSGLLFVPRAYQPHTIRAVADKKNTQNSKNPPEKSKKKKKKKSKKKKSSSWVFVLLLCVSIMGYMFLVIPLFRTTTDSVRLVILLGLHPLVRTVLEYIVRGGALKSRRKPRYACTGLFAVSSIFSLAARFFVTSSARAFDSAVLSIIFVAIQQYLSRTCRMEINQLSRWLRGKPQMTDAEAAHFKAVVAVEERQDMCIELASIVIATVFELCFWDIRWIIDLGYAATADGRPPISRTLLLCALQLVIEFFVDSACVYKEIKAGIPILSVWAKRDRGWMLREVLQMGEAATILLMTYHVVPYPFFCSSAQDVCSCSYARQLPAVEAHCFPGHDGAAGAAVAASLAGAVQACMEAGGACGGALNMTAQCMSECIGMQPVCN